MITTLEKEKHIPPLVDGFGRTLHYLRVSVTDRCNLHCRYCRGDNMPFVPHEAILLFEEMESIIAVAEKCGIRKLRFTGGEPFARRGFTDFLQRIRMRFPRLELTLTTNGTMLEHALKAIKEVEAGVNLSLDTMNRERFKAITGKDLLPAVLKNMNSMLEMNIPLKINAVALRGVNHDELPKLAALAMEYPIDVRFIEFMPMGKESIWSHEMFWPSDAVLHSIRNHWELIPALRTTEKQDILHSKRHESGPARLWKLKKGEHLSKGHVGVITSVTGSFCRSCNRLRLTADGHIRTCLYDDREYAVREALRRLGPDAVLRILTAAAARKPMGSELLARRNGPVTRKIMSAIGG